MTLKGYIKGVPVYTEPSVPPNTVVIIDEKKFIKALRGKDMPYGHPGLSLALKTIRVKQKES